MFRQAYAVCFNIIVMLVGKDTRKQEACIGHIIVQGVRPRAVIVPLPIGLAIQMHHHFRSKFLIDILSAMGYCTSYSEVQRFEENAASSIAPDVLLDFTHPIRWHCLKQIT